eukprot:gnl/Chilomastix_caulleri/7399.p1 GENE.gnl/Chilomastix_caulleri/7399~~gnl/Chilomastix_caulleri/7399.p1  ORF type:complete len:126 (+),score=21.32 gnl/Chilomastix_caulleri/7399:30-380(+)
MNGRSSGSTIDKKNDNDVSTNNNNVTTKENHGHHCNGLPLGSQQQVIDKEMFFSNYDVGLDTKTIDFHYPNGRPKHLVVGDYLLNQRRVDVDEIFCKYLILGIKSLDFMMLRGVAE